MPYLFVTRNSVELRMDSMTGIALGFSIVLAQFLSVHSQTQEPQGKDCGDGWFEAGAKCYIFVPMPKTWPEAKILCETTHFNASMVQLETMEEKRHVVNHLQATYEKIVPMSFFWVGAVGADSAWLWISGMPLTYVDFAEGIKTAPGCLAFGVPSLQKYQGMACTQQNLVLCERGAPTGSDGRPTSGSISGTTGGVPIVG